MWSYNTEGAYPYLHLKNLPGNSMVKNKFKSHAFTLNILPQGMFNICINHLPG